MRSQKGVALQGSSDGNACLFQGPSDGDEHAANWGDLSQAVANVERLEQANAHQRGRSWSLPVPDGVAARIPVVASRRRWLEQLRAVLASDSGDALRRAHDVSWRFVIAVAVAMALFSTSSNGRDVTASNASLAKRAGVSPRVVRRARKVLAELGFAVEVVRGRNHLNRYERMLAEAHHGGMQTRAASVWFLTMPRNAVASPRWASASRGPRPRALAAAGFPQVSATGHLPPSGGVSRSSCVSKISPMRASARAAAEAARQSKKKRIAHDPRPLHLLKAAAVLAARCGIDGRWVRTEDGRLVQNPLVRPRCGHLGAVADAIAAAGIDTARWLGHEIDNRLNRDNKDRGWNSPSSIHTPIAYLRARLGALDWTEPSPSELDAAQRMQIRVAAEQRHADHLRKPTGAVPVDHPARRAAREAARSRNVHRVPWTTPRHDARTAVAQNSEGIL